MILPSNIDLTNFHSFEGYHFISSNTIEYNGMMIYVTSTKLDDNKLWIGTSTGDIFIADLNLRSIEKISALPQFSDINLTYVDNNDDYWLTTNDFIFMNEDIFMGNNQIFLIRWLQDKNKWINYYQNKYLNIRSRDITSIYRKENVIYLGTKYGLLIFDFLKDKWTLIDNLKGLSNNYINNLDYYNDKLYIATNEGINIFSTIDNNLYPEDEFKNFSSDIIYDIKIMDDNLFLLSDLGFFQYDLKGKYMISFLNERYYKFDLVDNESILLSNRNKIYKLKKNEVEFITHLNDIENIKQCDDNNVWINQRSKAILVNLKQKETYIYNSNDGIPGNVINDIGCDKYWVWFSTNKGLSFYNWKKYHNDE